ncbi:DUF2382 domain-containing protein [Arthrobacter sp. MDT2-16]
MLTLNDLNPLIRYHRAVVTDQGDKVGSIGVVYLDDATEEPTWVTVHTGLFGTKESFVPLAGASVEGDHLVVRYPRDLIKHAPSTERDGHLGPEDERALYRHYGLIHPTARQGEAPAAAATAVAPATAAAAVTAAAPATAATAVAPATAATAAVPVAEVAQAPARTTSATAAATAPPVSYAPSEASTATYAQAETDTPAEAHASVAPVGTHEPAVPAHTPSFSPAPTETHDDGGTPWVVRSEERLRVDTEEYEAARVRLRKYVVTEEVSQSVPVEREELLIEREPITSATLDSDYTGSLFQEEAVEFVGREEHAVVMGKETVAVERVRLGRTKVTGRATVREQVRKERIASSVDGEGETGADTGTRRSGGRTRRATGSTGRGRVATSDDQAGRIVTNNPNPLIKGKNKKR